MCLWSHPFYLSFGQHFSCCCHLYMCRLFATERGFLHVLTTKLSMMKSCLAIFWMDFSATNAFFSSVERILFILDLRLEKRADFHYSLSARKKLIFSRSQISGPYFLTNTDCVRQVRNRFWWWDLQSVHVWFACISQSNVVLAIYIFIQYIYVQAFKVNL